MKKNKVMISGILLGMMLAVSACGINSGRTQANDREQTYQLLDLVEVRGRQGVAFEDGCYWVSGSAGLYKYDKEWQLIAENEDLFGEFELEVNHLGDIDVYNNEIYAGVENFIDGVGKNIQIAVYDGETLRLKRTFNFEASSGQLECSGICVDPDTKTVVMTSWVGEESGRYLYRYDLETGAYLGKVHMQAVPQWIQGIAYHNGKYYVTADDGTADEGEADHVYITELNSEQTYCTMEQFYTLDDVVFQGEIEGITFDKSNDNMLILYNRGSRIVLGMVKGFYEGYDREISEVYIYTKNHYR